jgi:arsenite methyltransferase
LVTNPRAKTRTGNDIHLPSDGLPEIHESVDLVISNCVVNLAADKAKAVKEAARVLRQGRRFAVCDVIADPGMDRVTRADMEQWTGCIAGALTETGFHDILVAAGLIDIEIPSTHRVHDHATSAIVRARKPTAAITASGCC